MLSRKVLQGGVLLGAGLAVSKWRRTEMGARTVGVRAEGIHAVDFFVAGPGWRTRRWTYSFGLRTARRIAAAGLRAPPDSEGEARTDQPQE